MTSARRPHLILAALAALALAGSARAGDPEMVTTAPPAAAGAPSTATGASSTAAGASSNVADQIDAYLKSSPALALPKDTASGVVSGDAPRQVHGVVDVSVGSNGYRSAFVESDLPVGKTGTLSIAVSKTEFKGRYGDRYAGEGRQSLGLGLALGGAADPASLACRQVAGPGYAMFDPRLSDSRPCRTPETPPPPQ
ncbi:hypothetical protein [Phenylobacterium sp.]|uniref:hypothetical protein n=1 Tax=Phenylobacterium sp. TaxID=1871053 RepID=UPI0012016EF2|nr:hypothetical protein [Phenylobacterium sp.]THD56122.1 MAG: hypothetical protein E8A12_15120 [Phenylobacterium sp.]